MEYLLTKILKLKGEIMKLRLFIILQSSIILGIISNTQASEVQCPNLNGVFKKCLWCRKTSPPRFTYTRIQQKNCETIRYQVATEVCQWKLPADFSRTTDCHLEVGNEIEFRLSPQGSSFKKLIKYSTGSVAVYQGINTVYPDRIEAQQHHKNGIISSTYSVLDSNNDINVFHENIYDHKLTRVQEFPTDLIIKNIDNGGEDLP